MAEKGGTHRVQRSPVLRKLNNLDRRLVPRLDARPLRQRHLREAHRPGVRAVRGPEQLELRHHGVGHVLRAVVGPVGAEAQVDVQQRLRVALEPAGLEGDRAARRGPVCPVFRRADAAACCRQYVSLFSFRISPLPIPHLPVSCFVFSHLVSSPLHK